MQEAASQELKNALIDEILPLEWRMFTTVNNEGSRASCQDDRITFEIMRRSQFDAWDPSSLKNYLEDLKMAEAEGRNLITEKYAHMMKSTAPEQYAAIKDRIAMPSDEAKELADKICSILLRQTEEYASLYPLMALQGRPLYANEDSSFVTSVETYQKGELYTYSTDTLQALYARILELQEQGRNFALMILENTVARYGFCSIDEAERAIRGTAE